jgi:formylglycine-generating enzyme required for sulfatase activity
LWVDRELAGIPWELLFDPEESDFIAHSRGTPVVRCRDLPAARKPPQEKPLEMLAVFANPVDQPQLDTEQEWRDLQAALAPLIDRKLIHLHRLEQATRKALGEYLRKNRCHILHFVGHGAFEKGEGALVLEDEGRRSQRIGKGRLAVLLRHHPLRLVVLNACDGARASEEDALSGVAQILVQRGIPSVIAMQFAVSDPAAVLFSRTFYTTYAEGRTVETALTEARRTLYTQLDDPEWAAPVLYLRSRISSEEPSRREKLLQALRGAAFRLRSRWRILAAAALLVLLGSLLHRWLNANPAECPSPPDLDMKFVLIHPGTFEMGDGTGDAARHKVTITKPFCMAAYELTNGQWDKVMAGGHGGTSGGDLPKTGSWEDGKEFVAALNRGKPGPYRYATEAEWEYAARAGSRARYSFGDNELALDEYANCRSGAKGAVPVGSYKPNAWGLYDMHGNVSEWVEDWYEPFDSRDATDPKGPLAGTSKVRRGGDFKSALPSCSSTKRGKQNPTYRETETGFRIVRDPIR